MSSVIAPMVHLNGTGRAALEKQLRDAIEALDAALSAMNRAFPHGRDYYPLGPAAYGEAREQWDVWYSDVKKAQNGIVAVYHKMEGLR